MYKFVQQHQDQHPVSVMCQCLSISRSAYYAWNRGKSYQPKADFIQVEKQLETAFFTHRRRYGARRLREELQDEGLAVSHYKVRKVMKKYGFKAIQPRSFIPRTTQSRHPYPISPNLLQDRPFPLKVNEVWVGDITYIPLSGSRWAYLAVWMDLCSRKIVGWSLADHMREELVSAALKQAFNQREASPDLLYIRTGADNMQEMTFVNC